MYLKMVEVDDIINVYNANSNSGMRVTPIFLYILYNSDYLTDSKKRTLSERRVAFKEGWSNLEYTDKSKYIEAATRLGYVSKLKHSSVEGSTTNLVSRLRAMRLARANKMAK